MASIFLSFSGGSSSSSSAVLNFLICVPSFFSVVVWWPTSSFCIFTLTNVGFPVKVKTFRVNVYFIYRINHFISALYLCNATASDIEQVKAVWILSKILLYCPTNSRNWFIFIDLTNSFLSPVLDTRKKQSLPKLTCIDSIVYPMNFAGCWTCWIAGCQYSSVCPVSRCKIVFLCRQKKEEKKYFIYSL